MIGLNRLITCGLVLLLLAIAGPKALAAPTTPKPTGITISPAFQLVNVSASQTDQPLSFKVTNDEPSAQTLRLTTADFNSLSDTGGLFFVGANPTQLQKKYGLAKWLQLPFTELSLAPGQTTTVNAKILNQPDLAPGGHYGAVNIELESGAGAGANNISVKPVASTLLFVTKLGGDTHKLNLSDVTTQHSLFSLPGSVNLRFHNDGNTHLIPRGSVTITSPGGQLISKGVINQNSDIILPELDRIYTVPLQKLAGAQAAGRYKLEVDFRFDGLDQPRAYQSSFLLIPIWPSLLIVVLLVLAAIALSVGWRRHRPKR